MQQVTGLLELLHDAFEKKRELQNSALGEVLETIGSGDMQRAAQQLDTFMTYSESLDMALATVLKVLTMGARNGQH